MTKEEILRELDFIIEAGFFKINDSLRVLKFRAQLEEDAPDKKIIEPIKSQETIKKAETIETKKPESSFKMPNEDIPF